MTIQEAIDRLENISAFRPMNEALAKYLLESYEAGVLDGNFQTFLRDRFGMQFEIVSNLGYKMWCSSPVNNRTYKMTDDRKKVLTDVDWRLILDCMSCLMGNLNDNSTYSVSLIEGVWMLREVHEGEYRIGQNNCLAVICELLEIDFEIKVIESVWGEIIEIKHYNNLSEAFQAIDNQDFGTDQIDSAMQWIDTPHWCKSKHPRTHHNFAVMCNAKNELPDPPATTLGRAK